MGNDGEACSGADREHCHIHVDSVRHRHSSSHTSESVLLLLPEAMHEPSVPTKAHLRSTHAELHTKHQLAIYGSNRKVVFSWILNLNSLITLSCSAMPRRKNVSLKKAKKAIWITPDGRCRLDLRNMGIATFPSWLFKLTNVTELDLSCNQLKKLPDNIGSFSSLSWLDLHSNKLESLPDSIGNLVRLTHLNLCNNRLASANLPSTVGLLTGLKCLNLGMNQLESLPPAFVALDGLTELLLFDNKLVVLPDFLKVFRNLSKLNLKGNPLLCAHGDDEETRERSAPAEDVYLVHESSLCETCATTCAELRRDGETETTERRKVKTFPGLTVPNSVAKHSQDQWRIRTETSKQTLT